MLQLVAYLPNEVQRFPLSRRLLTLGSSSDCDIRLPFPGVAGHHARLEREADAVLLQNLCADGSILVNGESTDAARLQVLDEIRLGRITLLLEDRRPDAGAAEAGKPAPATGTVSRRPSRQLLLERISTLSDWVLHDAESSDSLESLLRTLLADFGGGACFLFDGERRPLAVRVAVVSDPRWLAAGEKLFEAARGQAQPNRSIGHAECDLGGAPCWVCYRASSALDQRYLAVFAFDRFQPTDWTPEIGLAVIADLVVLGMVHHVGRYEPILPGHAGQRGVTIAPGLIVGPSAATERLMDRLRAAADADCHVLVLGEEGSGRELVARTLHLSGPRHDGPFVVASCDGADPKAIEADLFGAEVAGRKQPLRRDGKLLLAAQGTLFLDSVDALPLDVQARLVRVLRSGELEGPAGGERHRVDPRIVASSRASLLDLVARGRFRADLAHRLGQLAIQVPPLRERMEDLPILVQTYVNRFSHETGKRVRGITMQALAALARYPFPGNLRELENAVRQMVYLAREPSPMDVDLLPAEIREAGLVDARVEEGSQLELSSLVASVERAAIQEALRRTSGNKAHAARLLGLSRNGLAQKMSRHQL
jgi:transcriptional regulator with AAA-type ATPase domain